MMIRIYTEQNLTPETWITDAACSTTNPDIFFSEVGDWRGTQAAISICNGCDVAAQCLEYALRTDQRDGVWGGLSQVARTRLRKKRNTA